MLMVYLGQPIEYNEVVEYSFGTVTDEDIIIKNLEEKSKHKNQGIYLQNFKKML